MRFKAIWKDTFREITKSKMRFLAILTIILLGVAFYVGISATGPDMIATSDEYFKGLELMDYRVQSTYGLTDEDIESLENSEDFNVQRHYAYDFMLEDASTIRLYSLDPENGQEINKYHVLEGRLPEKTGEIALDHKKHLREGTKVGDTITLDTGESAGDPKENLNQTRFEVVGLVNSPLFVEIESRGISSIGSGKLNAFGVIVEADYAADLFTEAYVKIDGSKNFEAFSDGYENYIKQYLPELEQTLDNLAIRRDESIQDEIQEELADGRAEIADAEKELAEAEAELEEARIEIDDGWQEFEDGKAELAQETADAKKEIAENEQKLRDGAQELEENKQDLLEQKKDLEAEQAKLLQNERELLDGIAQLEDGISQVKAGIKEIDQNLPELQAGIQQVETTKQELLENKTELEQALQLPEVDHEEIRAQIAQIDQGLEAANEKQKELQANVDQLTPMIQELENQLAGIDNQLETETDEAVIQQLEAQKQELTEQLTEINGNISSLQAGIQEVEATKKELQENRAQLEQALQIPELDHAELSEQLAQVEAGLEEVNAKEQELKATLESVTAQRQDLETQLTELQTQLMDLESKKKQLAEGKAQIEDGFTQINDGLALIREKEQEIQTGFNEIEEAKNTLAEETAKAQSELDEAEAELKEAEVDYQEGLATFEEERADALVEIADAKEDIAEAEADLATLAKPEYMHFDRTDNFGYSEFKDNADRLSVIAKVFPVFFFLIAIFISFTTMTRMVDEEREYIGIMKAMGYKDRFILIKFIVYAAIATVIGASLGLIIGYTLFPKLIFFAYSSLYNFPDVVLQQYTLYTVIALIFAFVSTVGASLLAVQYSLRHNAARLLQPKPPKKGSRIWLERIGFIWNRLSFNYKITFRNVFRYKSRMLMTILGIAGSTGLILTGFGISDSVGDIPDIQYGEVNQFQAYVAIDPNVSSDKLADYRTVAQEKDSITDDLFVVQQNVRAEKEGMITQDINFFVPEEPNRIGEFVRLANYEDLEHIYELDDSGAYITQKIAQLLEVDIGDEVEVLNADDQVWTIEVAGIVENYMAHFAYMTPEYYNKISGENFDHPDVQLIKYDTDQVNTDTLGSQLIEEDAVVGIQYVEDIHDAFAGSIESLDLITQILVISAAVLAFIVLYNLTNINVSERSRELSTIKVLGSHDFEVTTYIYRENIILTILGILVGLGFGNILTKFIMRTMEVDMLVFGRNIYFLSYLYSSLLTILFSLVVMVVIHFQLKKIDMVEALKGND